MFSKDGKKTAEYEDASKTDEELASPMEKFSHVTITKGDWPETDSIATDEGISSKADYSEFEGNYRSHPMEEFSTSDFWSISTQKLSKAVFKDDKDTIDTFFYSKCYLSDDIRYLDLLKDLLYGALTYHGRIEGRAVQSILAHFERIFEENMYRVDIDHKFSNETLKKLFTAVCFHGRSVAILSRILNRLPEDIILKGLTMAVQRGHVEVVKEILRRRTDADNTGGGMLNVLKISIMLTNPDWRIHDLILEAINEIVGCVGESMNKESTVLYRTLRDIAIHTAGPTFKVRSPLQNQWMELICDRRLLYLPRLCTSRLYHSTEEKEEEVKGLGRSVAEAAFHAMKSGHGCLKSLYPYRYHTIHRIIQIRMFLEDLKPAYISYLNFHILRWTRKAIDKNNILLVERIMREIDPITTEMEELLKDDSFTNSNEAMHRLMKSVIEKRFATKYKGYFIFHKAFMAKRGESLHIVSVYDGREKPNEDKFLGLPIEWRPLEDLDFNGFQGSSPRLGLQDSITVSNRIAELLFKKHSNLNIITSSGVCLRGNKMRRISCIVLYCWAKGCIPLYEKPFPFHIQNIPTDVREGFCVPGGTGLQIGSAIRAKDFPKLGTLGGFVDINGGTYGVTCAHVLFPVNRLTRTINIRQSVCTDEGHVIGETNTGCFRHGDPNETSVDAALFCIDEKESSEIKGVFPKTKPQELRMIGYDVISPPVFSSGEILDIHDRKHLRFPVIKYGIGTRLTKGTIACEGCHVRIHHISLMLEKSVNLTRNLTRTTSQSLDDQGEDMDIDNESFPQMPNENPNEFIMYKQAEIESHALSFPFFTQGDSGSFVFYEDDDGILKCVGMAIGCTSYGTCIMTPIMNVLETLGECLGLPREGKLPLKKFSRTDSSPDIIYTRENITTAADEETTQSSMRHDSSGNQSPSDITNHLRMFSESITSSLETLKEELKQLNTNMEKKETRFEAFQTEVNNRLMSLEERNKNLERTQNDTVEDSDDDL